jgi:hypothetical protein
VPPDPGPLRSAAGAGAMYGALAPPRKTPGFSFSQRARLSRGLVWLLGLVGPKHALRGVGHIAAYLLAGVGDITAYLLGDIGCASRHILRSRGNF